jgi:hypothetical protein
MKVVLIEPHFSGHRPTYLYLYSKLLIELGHSVSIVCADEEICRNFIVTEKGLSSVTVYPFKEYKTSSTFSKSRNFYTTYVLWKRVKESLKQIEDVDFVFFMYFDYFLFHYNERWLRFGRVNKTLNQILNKCYLPGFIENCLPVKWSGIFFHPYYYQHKEYTLFFRSKYNKSICLLDETYQLPFEVKNKFILPDITDEQNSDKLSSLAETILKKAKGRKIISLLGSLEKRKGILQLMDVIRLMDPTKYFFIIAGKLNGNFSEEDVNRLKSLQANIENCHIMVDGITDESDFNSLVRITDIIYLLYINFVHSSNLLTKASLFNKPVLAQKGYCIGKRVDLYKTGITISDNSIENIKETLENFNFLFDPSKAQYAQYLSAHSIARLRQSFLQIFKTTDSI